MDNENTMLTDQEEAVETSDAFFDGWGDETDDAADGDGLDADWSFDSDSRDTDEESEGTEADADQQEADGTEGEESNGESEEGKSEGNEGDSDQSTSFTLRHLGEERTVDREEVISLAQKGMDYDRIREKWDGVKDDVQKLRMYEGFLKELADARGDGDIEALIDETRTRSLIAQAKAKGEDLDASVAAAQAVKKRLQGMGQQDPAAASPDEAALMAKRREAVDRFRSTYKDVKAEDIPKEVWDEADKTFDLVGPYQRYLNQKLEADNKRLKEELEQAKQQQKNKERSMGSSRSVGKAATKDPFEEGWDDSD